MFLTARRQTPLQGWRAFIRNTELTLQHGKCVFSRVVHREVNTNFGTNTLLYIIFFIVGSHVYSCQTGSVPKAPLLVVLRVRVAVGRRGNLHARTRSGKGGNNYSLLPPPPAMMCYYLNYTTTCQQTKQLHKYLLLII